MKVWLILLGFTSAWLGMWTFVAWKTAQGGWSALLSRHAAAGFPSGKRIRGVSGWFPRSHYSGALVALAAANGLFLRPVFLFRLFHPPLLIPWSCITAISEESGRWTKATTLVGEVDAASFKLLLPGAHQAEIERHIYGNTNPRVTAAKR